MSTIDVVTDGIRRHAGRIEAIGDDITTARAAAGQVSMNSEAYGKLCSPILVPVLAVLETAGIAAMTVGAGAVDMTAGALRTMATSLDVVDEIASRRMQGVRR